MVEALRQGSADMSAADMDGKTPLHIAAAAWGFKMVRKLLDVAADATAPDSNGMTVLHVVACCRDVETVKAVLSANADTNATAKDGTTPLHIAVRTGHLAVASVLMVAGGKAFAKDKKGKTPVHIAASYKDLAIFSRLLLADADEREWSSRSGEGLEHLLSERELNAVRSLREPRLQWIGQDVLRVTALVRVHCDSLKAQVSSVQADCADLWYPVRADARRNIVCTLQRALAHPCCQRACEASSALMKERVLMSSLPMAAEAFHEDVVKLLMASRTHSDFGGCEANKKDANLLHCEAGSGNLQMVSALLLAGEDESARDKEGRTPLHKAARSKHTEVVEMLLASGADACAEDEAGQSPLHEAAGAEHLEVVSALLAAGGKVSGKT